MAEANLSGALSVLSAMITPAVLISASGTLILTTTLRLQRIVERVRELAARADEMWLSQQNVDFPEERQKLIKDQLQIQARRANIAQRALSFFYLALGIFVADSVTIGVTALRFANLGSVPIALGLLGTLVMLVGSVWMVIETHLAVRSTRMEMSFSLSLGHLRESKSSSKRTELE